MYNLFLFHETFHKQKFPEKNYERYTTAYAQNDKGLKHVCIHFLISNEFLPK